VSLPAGSGGGAAARTPGVTKSQRQETMAEATGKFCMHPAGPALSTVAPRDTSATVLMARR